ncbi:hypothetical protein F4777DRAFT_576817 [Nemania sp. FL0916]|nr:hypothetical protein F4777DRAFT_576817 [Nemania sp. FL0916]
MDWTATDTHVPCSLLMTEYDKLHAAEKYHISDLFAHMPDDQAEQVGRNVDRVLAERNYVTETPREDYYLSPGRFSRIVRARRNIRSGQEITVEYLNPWTEDKAIIFLEIWGFECQCRVCDDYTTRLQYERVFEEIRDNAEALFEGTDSTPEEVIARNESRIAALQLLGPSIDLVQELNLVIKLYNEAGQQGKVEQALRALYETMTVICDENDVTRQALQRRFG